jgi:PAS domain-containing protein
MPGALVYTDERLNIVFCNERFREVYAAPAELLAPGRPYPAFLRFLAENGYYGEGDLDALVAQRVESLRNPSDRSFEDQTPDGRWLRIRRRRAAGGGTITVMTDITEQKQAERALASKEAQLHAALDNSRARWSTPMSILMLFSATTASETCMARPRNCFSRRAAGGGTVTVMTDITQQKQAERELIEANQRMEEASKVITEKNRMLEALTSELRDKNRKVEEQAAELAEWNATLET